MAADRRYWDANAFLGWFNDEQDKVGACQGVLEAAESGTIEIVTSALTLVEVIKLKGEKHLPREKEEIIRGFFENPYIIVREVDRFIAEDARELIWAHNLNPKDSVHLATALRLKLSVLDTFDRDLMKLTGKLGVPKLIIGHPNVPHTPDMFPETHSDSVVGRRKRTKKKR